MAAAVARSLRTCPVHHARACYLHTHCASTVCALLVHMGCECTARARHAERVYGHAPSRVPVRHPCSGPTPWIHTAEAGWGGVGLSDQTLSTRRSAISGTPANEGAGDGWTRGFLGGAPACIAIWEWLGNDCAMLLQPPPDPIRRPRIASLQASGFDPV